MEKDRNKYVRKYKEELRKSKGIPKVKNLINEDNISFSEPPKGEPESVCEVCGMKFKQDFYKSRNCYSSYKTCHSCRKKIANQNKKEQPEEIAVATATLPFEPYPWQWQAFEAFKKNRFNVWACGNRCLLEGDFIQGCNKPIEELDEGDVVYDKFGKEQKVKYAGFNYYTGDVYTIRSSGCIETICNDEHRVYVCKIDKKTKEIVDERFVHAKDLGEYCDLSRKSKYKYCTKIPKIKKEINCDFWELDDGAKIELTEDFCWVLGLYCAEGCCISNSLKWTLNAKQPDLAEKTSKIIENIGYHTSQRIREDEGTHCVLTYKRSFVRKIDFEIGHGSYNKKIPESILFNKNKNILIAFLKGYYAGDGYYNQKSFSMTASSSSKILMLELQIAWHRLGYFARIQKCKRKSTGKEEYQIYLLDPKANLILGVDTGRTKFRQAAIIKNNCIYTPIKSISKEFRDCKIYNIETEDGTFVHNNQITGNSGKDFCANMIGIWYFVQCLNENRAIKKPTMAPAVFWWIIAPTEPMAEQNWRDLKKQFPKDWIVSCSDSDKTMHTIGDGLIQVRSAYNPESLVGVGLDLVTITEAARIANLDKVWANIEPRLSSQGRGLESDRGGSDHGYGKAIINSTPLGKNFFYNMFKWGLPGSNEKTTDWISFQFPWTCNPSNEHLSQKIIQTKYGEMTYEEDLRRRLGDRLYRQNYLADFLAMDGTVFKDFEEKCVINPYNMGMSKKEREEYKAKWNEIIPYHSYRIGYDPATGSSADTPAVVVRDMDTNNIVLVVDLYGKNYDEQWDEISFISKKYNYAPCAWLRTGHTAIENQLAKRGVVEIPLDEQAGKKAMYIQSLERAIQNGDVHVLLDGTETVQTLVLEMNDYSEKAGKYSNEQQEHDDFVSAMYAVYYDYSEAEEKVIYFGMMGAIKYDS